MSSTAENQRVNFASIKNQFPYPDFLEVQLKSFQDFLQLDTPPEKRKKEGLYKVFAENFPIADTRNNFVLEFLDYYIDPPRYTIDECIARGLTYSVPLKAKLKLYCTDPDHEDFDTVIQDVYLGPIPYMTERGTFVINGAERVVVSQLHRSPGVFFGQSTHANGTKLYSARIIPFKGSWIEFATDINNVMYAYIDRKKKLPVTTLLRAIGFESDKDILEIFNLAEEVKVSKANLKKLIGRKLAARVLKTWVEDFVDEDTGEVVSIERNDVIIDRESVLDSDNIEAILESGTQNILLHREDQNLSDYAIIYNTLQKDPSNSEKEAVLYIYRQLRNAEPADEASAREVIQNLFFSEKRYDLGEVGDSLKELTVALNATTEPHKKGILGVFQKAKRSVDSIKANYAKAESNVDRIEKDLMKHRDVLEQDISMYQQMYELNYQYYKELTMYIIAGKKSLDKARRTKLVELKNTAEETNKQEDVQAYRDFDDLCHRFEKKLSDLEITRVISLQSAPQVRMLQNNDREMMDKLQSSLANTIPLWRNQLVLSLGIEHTSRALEAQGALSEKTNELLKKNAETLKMATIESAKQSESSIVDIDTLKQCNNALISSINEVITIHEQGAARRAKAQEELVKLEEELKSAIVGSEKN